MPLHWSSFTTHPGEQTQSDGSSLPVPTVVEPVGQLLQGSSDPPLEKVPAGHTAQFNPPLPGTQTQAACC